MVYPSLNLIPGTLWIPETKRAGKKGVELPSLRLAIGDWQALPSSSFFSYKSSYHFRPRFKLPPNFIFQCYRPQTWQFYFFSLSPCSFNFWYSQCQVLNLRVGRSRDQVLQRAIFGLSRPFALPIALRAPCHSYSFLVFFLFLLLSR